MADLIPVTVAEVDALLRAARMQPSTELPRPEPTRALAPRTPGYLLEQEDENCVHVRWYGHRPGYVQNRLNVAGAELEAVGLRVIRIGDAPRFWLEVFRRAEGAGADG